jgi:hypothetical protein
MSWIIDKERLHITIGSTPQDSERLTPKLDLDNELQMIKAALLYGEHATLCSPIASVLTELLSFTDFSFSQKLAFFEIIPSWFPKEPLAEQATTLLSLYKRARNRRHSKKGQESLRKFERALDETWPVLSDGIRDLITKLGADELITASESGFLDIHRFDAPIERLVMDDQRRGFVEEYVSVVGASVSDKLTYPLFDEETSSIISAGIVAGLIPVSDLGITRGKEVGLAADLFKRLPLFPHASVKEILDIRGGIRERLVTFPRRNA